MDYKMSNFLQTLTSQELEKCFDKIRDTIDGKDFRIRHLEKKNKELLDEAYKDNQLKEMKERLERMQADYWRGFPITEEESKEIEKWCKEHDRKVHGLKTDRDRIKAGGCIGGRYSYEFTPTSIGVIGEVRCSCGKKFTFCELD